MAAVLLAALLTAATPEMPAVDTPSHCYTVAQRVTLDQVLAVDEFRIRYTLAGPDALADQEDANHNGTPDVIENIATQLVTARDVYRDLLHLHPPLTQPRYLAAHGIEVLVRKLNGINGLSYDEVTRRGAGASLSDCSLTISLTNSLRFDRNASPAHELFHLFQYGYSMFKRGWYLEGMARWIESAFVGPTTPAPPPPSCGSVTGSTYAAAGFWRALAQQAGGSLRYSPAFRMRTYIDGRPVIAVAEFPGGLAVRVMLEALGRAGDAAEQRDRLPRFAVPEAVQKSARYDSDICQAVEALATGRKGG